MHLGVLMKHLAKYKGGRNPHLGYSPASLIADVATWKNDFYHSYNYTKPGPAYLSGSCDNTCNLVGTEVQRLIDSKQIYLGGLGLKQ